MVALQFGLEVSMEYDETGCGGDSIGQESLTNEEWAVHRDVPAIGGKGIWPAVAPGCWHVLYRQVGC